MPFTVQLRVEPGDIDELAHVNNAVYLRWVQAAATEHSRAAGLGMAHYLDSGHAFLVRRHDIEYLKPALPGDVLDVETRVVSMTVATAERTTAVRRSGELLVRAYTRWAYVQLSNGRPARIPDELRARFPIDPQDPELEIPPRRRNE